MIHNNLLIPAVMSHLEIRSKELWTEPEIDSFSLLKDDSVWFAEIKCGDLWSTGFPKQGILLTRNALMDSFWRLHSLTFFSFWRPPAFLGSWPLPYLLLSSSHLLLLILILLHPSYKNPRDYVGYQSKIIFPSQDPSLTHICKVSFAM